MNLPREIDYRISFGLIIVLIFGLMVLSFFAGYFRSSENTARRMHEYDNKGEECYTREEVDSFIYGERWTEVY